MIRLLGRRGGDLRLAKPTLIDITMRPCGAVATHSAHGRDLSKIRSSSLTAELGFADEPQVYYPNMGHVVVISVDGWRLCPS